MTYVLDSHIFSLTMGCHTEQAPEHSQEHGLRKRNCLAGSHLNPWIDLPGKAYLRRVC